MAFIYNKHLFQCDNLYKKALNSIDVNNFIKKLAIKLPLGEFVKEINQFSNFTQSVNDTQLKGFLLFYINYFICPYINFPKSIKELVETSYVLTIFLPKAEKFLFNFLNDTYYSFFEKHLEEKKYTKFTKKKTLLLKNNYLNSASFRFYVSNVLDSNNFKTLSFYTYFIF
jgi:hypothetical protein